MIRLRRVYEEPSGDEGVRVLVDRIWPRGVRKEALPLDEWPRELTPSPELRHWFHGPDGDFDEFRRRYRAELAAEAPAATLEKPHRLDAEGRTVTLPTSAKDPAHGQPAVLAEVLDEMRDGHRGGHGGGRR
ncbi:DUF488 domain-containing protein [Streptomyces triticirhizae]|uniref:DUF488 family protein n=1 Tax=Streptomyces triticirhizae TaxID=2483353 RepID=A0A3M2LM39_9ACTN|nr:DUF488 family protein [Streptomyces triticirhizae]RMI38186.1 DUF488 family protein [Streptomyces triticirhizae]